MSRTVLALLLGVVAVTSLPACAADAGSDEAVSADDEEPIVGGKDDDGDPAVVAINVEGTGVTVCTGTLIAPDVVLSAGHCPTNHMWIRQGSSVTGLGWFHHSDIKEAENHPRYSGEGKHFDIKLIHLTDELDGVEPVRLSDEPLTRADVGIRIRHVGFGETGDAWGGVKDLGSAGTKRTVTYPITKVDPFSVWSGAPGKQTCNFDSGGPALRKRHGVERLIAVVSAGKNCETDGWDVRVDREDIRSWIDATLKKWGSKRPQK